MVERLAVNQRIGVRFLVDELKGNAINTFRPRIHRKSWKMKVIEERQTTVAVTKDIICNRCGESCRADWGPNDVYEGLFNISVTGGYGSRYLGDMNTYQFDVCEKCLSEWFDSFKHDPFVDSHL